MSKGKDLALGNGNQKTYWHRLEELNLVTPFSFCLGLDYCHREIPTTLLIDWHSTIHIYKFIDRPPPPSCSGSHKKARASAAWTIRASSLCNDVGAECHMVN